MVCGEMKTYDFAFSLGFSCAASESLRDLGFQKESLPFDWTGAPSLRASVDMVACGFAGWFDRDALRLWDVRHEGGFIARVYKNMKTGFGFSHEFSNADPIERSYDAVREKYERRISRLGRELKTRRRILALYLESPVKPRISDGEISAALAVLRAKCPQAEVVDLVYIYEDETCKKAEVLSSVAGATVVRAHYRTYLDGRPMHICDRSQVAGFLRESISIDGALTEAQLRAFDAEKRRRLRASLGTNRVNRWVNKKLKQWCRDLEVYLIGQKLIPGDRPLWFDGDGK